MDSLGQNGDKICQFKKYGSMSDEDSSGSTSTDNHYLSADETDPLLIDGVKLHENGLKRRIWFNIGLLNVLAFFLYMGIVPIVLVQSSLNSDAGLGVAAMAVKNGFMVVGSILAPSIIYKFGCKSAAMIGLVMYITFVPANFYPSWYTLIPFAMIGGVGCMIQAISFKVYVARLAHLYADLTNMDEDRINSRVFLLLACFTYISFVGNIFASLILNTGVTDDIYNDTNHDDSVNYHHQRAICGANYCNQPLSNTDDGPSVFNNVTTPQSDSSNDHNYERMYLLVGFCTLSSLISVAIATFIDPLAKFAIKESEEQLNKSPISIFKNLLRAMKNPLHILFIPMAIALNGGDSFWSADFTKAFITCSITAGSIGYVSVWNGLGAALACWVLGWYNNKSVRCVPVFLSTVIQLITLTGLFLWTPSASETTNYWSLSAYGLLFHVGSGIRNFVAPVLVSVVFKDDLETAFSVYHFWTNISSTMFYAWSNFLCITFKIYFLMAIMALSFICYIAMEVLVQRNSCTARSSYQPLN